MDGEHKIPLQIAAPVLAAAVVVAAAIVWQFWPRSEVAGRRAKTADETQKAPPDDALAQLGTQLHLDILAATISGWVCPLAVVVIVVAVGVIIMGSRRPTIAGMNPDVRYELTWGSLNPEMICPHCQTKAAVRTKQVTRKIGLSGPKATAAFLTGGLSILATGLSQESNGTQAHCDNCQATWLF